VYTLPLGLSMLQKKPFSAQEHTAPHNFSSYPTLALRRPLQRTIFCSSSTSLSMGRIYTIISGAFVLEAGKCARCNPQFKAPSSVSESHAIGSPVDHYTSVPSTATSGGADKMTVRLLSHPDRWHTEIAFLCVAPQPDPVDQNTNRIGRQSLQ